MKTHRDVLTVSSILFTLALLITMAEMFQFAWTLNQTLFHMADHPWFEGFLPQIGLASLATIVVGLVVIWVGYIKGARWAWFVMFVIVWVWAFPVFLLPILPHTKNAVPITHLLPGAIGEVGVARDFVEIVLAFLLMALALVLPIKTFFLGRAGGHASKADVMSNQS